MGLTTGSTGRRAVDEGLAIKRQSPKEKVIAIAGNPNVGKSTVFNGLTGLNQHTGNWPGKTVANAQGRCQSGLHQYVLVDIPGAYSLMAHSAEEEVARNFICFGAHDGVVVVCDASCLERNLNLVLQTMEISGNVIVCVNLMDEARRKGINVDLQGLSRRLGVPVVGTIARKKKTLSVLLTALDGLMTSKVQHCRTIPYPKAIEEAIAVLTPAIAPIAGEERARWLSLKLLDGDELLLKEIDARYTVFHNKTVRAALIQAREILQKNELDGEHFKDAVVSSILKEAESICCETVAKEGKGYSEMDRRLDRMLTGKLVGYPVMFLLLCFVFWLTIVGANVPSQWLAEKLGVVQGWLSAAVLALGAPRWLHDMLVLGVYQVLAWVVSVMLPPMAIFFPLFTLLEDAGYLPRVAYNLDRPFKRCGACGKQALCCCMGFGCNAAGVVGCRIIDSPRERLIAILTNNFVPCNGRFPTLIAILTMFFLVEGAGSSLLSSVLLTAAIGLGIAMTFFASWLLSKTVLKGVPSSFALELPSYRRPQIGKVLVRSVMDRTLFVLGRAVAVAAPAGLLIWVMANVQVDGMSLLNHASGFLDPFARFVGMDGVILLAFILGFPANEIVIPIIIMTYLAQGTLVEMESLAEMKTLFVDHGWTWLTALCTMLFSLMHWPCSTTMLTIYKETGSKRWSALAFMLPTLCGLLACALAANMARLLGLV